MARAVALDDDDIARIRATRDEMARFDFLPEIPALLQTLDKILTVAADEAPAPQPVAIGPEDTAIIVEALEYTAARKPGAQVERIARIRAALTGRLS